MVGGDSDRDEFLFEEFQDLKTTLQQQQEDVTTSLKNLRWLIKTRANALLYLRTTLGEECYDITQLPIVDLIGILANARMYWTAPDCGESYASTAVVKMAAIITFLGLQIKEAESTMGSLGNMCSSFWWKLHRRTEKDYFNGDSCRRDCSTSFSWYDHINFLGSCFIF
ncbi:putative ABC transporter C family member [Trifolium repens]|nr:putative ABC transporter C family member [Trifolium repens]